MNQELFMDEVWEKTTKITEILYATKKNDEHIIDATQELIKLLAFMEENEISYPPIVNHLIRQVGLYPYIQIDDNEQNIEWTDKYVYKQFSVDTGNETKVLHREQSLLLKKLLEGQNIAVSAPTSFGKTFVIDLLLYIKQPKVVVILVPTIALMDELRRRIQQKFKESYDIITVADQIDSSSEKNKIYIFPQERVDSCLEHIKAIDILVVEEFYKISSEFDDGRSNTLIQSIIKLKKIAQQRYFLAPNFDNIDPHVFKVIDSDMKFVHLKSSPVFIKEHDWTKECKTPQLKENKLIEIINQSQKNLIYAGSHAKVTSLIKLCTDRLPIKKSDILPLYSQWLKKNYTSSWKLSDLVNKGVGIHHGKLHRSISQLNVRLFESKDGLDSLIVTSSIIEGVNTVAENVILWHNPTQKKYTLTTLSYKNLKGRAGRMFQYFIGNCYLLSSPPKQDKQLLLDIQITPNTYTHIDDADISTEMPREEYIQASGKIKFIEQFFETKNFKKLKKKLITSDIDRIITIFNKLRKNPQIFNAIRYESKKLYDFLEDMECLGILQFPISNGLKILYVLYENWQRPYSEIINTILQDISGSTVEDIFNIESKISFDLHSLLHDTSIIYNALHEKDSKKYPKHDISAFLTVMTHAFLPKNVYYLEEYGLPRMISYKINRAKIINFDDSDISFHQCLKYFYNEEKKKQIKKLTTLDKFDHYIIKYFYEGLGEQY